MAAIKLGFKFCYVQTIGCSIKSFFLLHHYHNQVADQRVLLKQWFSSGAHSCS